MIMMRVLLILVLINLCLLLQAQCIHTPIDDIYVPNAFSPNGDGVNDKLFVYGDGEFILKIFDRWGEKVFESRNFDKGWNGRYKGRLLNSNVFVYYILFCNRDGIWNKQKRGSIMLIM